MRTWDRLSATFVRGLKKPGKFYDGGGLLLQATPTKRKGVVNKSLALPVRVSSRAEQARASATSGLAPRA